MQRSRERITCCNFQKVRSVWQRDVQRNLIRISQAFGGKTSISSKTSGSPAFLATAAAPHSKPQTNYTEREREREK